MLFHMKNKRKKVCKGFPSGWYEEYDGGIIMDEAPRDALGRKRPIGEEYHNKTVTQKPKDSNKR